MTLRTQDSARTITCANNLSQLWKSAYIYMVRFGGSHKLMPVETGDAFWLKLSSPGTPVIHGELIEIYQCPVENNDDKGCDYRGPATNVNKHKDGDPVGADVDGNHGIGKGGNVLRKSGDVQTVSADTSLWKAAAIKTSGGNKAHSPEILSPEDRTPNQVKALLHIGHLFMGAYIYKLFNGTFPRSFRALVERSDEPQVWPEGGFYPGGSLPKDPWGNEYLYKFEPDSLRPEIWTWGADGKKGGKGEDHDLEFNDLSMQRSRSKSKTDGDKARQAVTRVLLQRVANLIMEFKMDTGKYPKDLRELVVRPSSIPEEDWRGPYLKRTPRDGWSYDLHYEVPGPEGFPFHLYSLGADDQPGGTGSDADISNLD